MSISRLSHCLDDDYPTIDWMRHAPMADLWLSVDDRHKAAQPITELLERIEYHLPLSPDWPRVDCVSMVPGLGISARARTVLEAVGVPGMEFLEYRVNSEPFFLFYTIRRVDCLDRQRAEVEFFRSSPDRVKTVLRYAFRMDRLRTSDVFTVPELSDGMFFWSQEMFFTPAAQRAVERAKLVGFRFEELPGCTAAG